MSLTLRLNPVVKKVKVDNREWERMKRRLLKGASEKRVDGGWWGTNHPSGISHAWLAMLNDEGHPNGGIFAGTYTAPRPFMSRGVTNALPRLVNAHIRFVDDIARGRVTWTWLNRNLEQELDSLIKTTIKDWTRPANRPITVEIKGFNNPLIDTGSLLQNVKTRISPLRSLM